MKEPKLYIEELCLNHGDNNFIFVGSSIDIFAEQIPEEIIWTVIHDCEIKLRSCNNKYLFQSKNPYGFADFIFPDNTILCTTIETNKPYKQIMGNCPMPIDRYHHFCDLQFDKKMLTIEPIMDFDHDIMMEWIWNIHPMQINIGADSVGNHLPEPSKEKTLDFINALKGLGYNVYIKDNLKRIIGGCYVQE